MTYSDEMLMAYVDRELDAATTASIDAAIARDPELAGRVERQRRLAHAVHAAYEPVLAEPMPQRLLSAAGGTASAASTTRAPRHWAWFEWSAMAASIVVGVVVGTAFVGNRDAGDEIFASQGRLVARGALARALSDQLASTQKTDVPIRIGMTFVSKGGEFCRTFALERGGASGLACASGGDWQVQVVARGASKSGEYRQAAGALPPSVQQAVDERIEGISLDAAAEQAAQQRGWKR